MKALILSRETLVWLVLMAMTITSWVLAYTHGMLLPSARYEAVLILSLAFIKARLVLMHFMEAGHAPLQLRIPCEAWVLLSAGALILLESGLLSA
ncbi:cytochrome C oxidase subunit IV family protein [Pseudomonas sp. 273]|uniref:cytochrome C oxidase subunit IV family protein n=1 Tax=Pseudomonas TaxID=286 RepID=UPI0023D86EEF|nr:cytochrome C oxidase subunit IV family protein [Pseudomonas sp. 273]